MVHPFLPIFCHYDERNRKNQEEKYEGLLTKGRTKEKMPIFKIFSFRLFISPIKDFLFTGPAEIGGFLVNLFYVSGSIHHTP